MARYQQKEQIERQNITENITKEKQKPVRSKLFLVAGLILLLFVSGIAGFLYFDHNEKDKITEVKKEKESAFAGEKKGEEAFGLPSIVVNLAGSNEHYVRVTCVLVFSKSNKKLAQELEEKNYVLCDTLIKTLRGKKAEEIQKDPAAKKLKDDLRQAMNNQLNSGKVNGIYFTELLVQ
jgi:flagellar basal body-associated protein FliL